ncbi:hypothetical protein [Nostoc sp. UHCC 0252]|uniref:hypothetical protein n=1 Tax=Nostoc sp. UHCC 0252 TaxID=3110241 RepID=UPI002B20472F|nr:hypothetical protein [Nostoc sp. UHCC 0252]MEA5605273.1 hypothetical protein [Nostoc sp. UHCC 0252]
MTQPRCRRIESEKVEITKEIKKPLTKSFVFPIRNYYIYLSQGLYYLMAESANSSI